MAQIEQIIWFTEYEDEIICDLAAIYGILDAEELGGPDFVRFARHLIYYQGAVAGKMKLDYREANPDSDYPEYTGSSSSNTIKMSDAVHERGLDVGMFNAESQMAGMGDLFERVSVPAN